jgi:hypothetical protein
MFSFVGIKEFSLLVYVSVQLLSCLKLSVKKCESRCDTVYLFKKINIKKYKVLASRNSWKAFFMKMTEITVDLRN